MVVSFVCSFEQETDQFLKSGPVRKAEGNSPGSSVSKTKGTDPVGHINGRFHGATRAARGVPVFAGNGQRDYTRKGNRYG